ncbi:DUF4249 family protein [Cyclobacterium plantarum]|uniref:DUF4249 domain-containing protein n=1 Tax=Cyclobacterium plantarum TaxID=2716263 RepID=A0ABX0HE04_9BACT|nr:DUF4249 family protein [Cyclobacterium plantarum]NHE58563.1 DUF4249 domain-containing protein [Cyclobacterium plantarum]
MKNTMRLIPVIMFLGACTMEEPISEFLDDQSTEPGLVVESIFTNKAVVQQVKLTFSQTAGELNDEAVPVEGANLLITGNDQEYVLLEVKPGIYETEGPVKGEIGQRYTLRIEYQGNIYEGSDMLEPIASHQPIELVMEIDGFYSIPFRPHQFGYEEPNRYNLSVFIPDSLWTENFENVTKNRIWTYYTHPFFEPNGVFEFVATDYKTFGEHTYYLRQKKYSISDSYYDYLRALFSETEWRGSLLDSNPGKIPTNLVNLSKGNSAGIMGFFATCATDELIYKYPDRE